MNNACCETMCLIIFNSSLAIINVNPASSVTSPVVVIEPLSSVTTRVVVESQRVVA